MSSLSPDLHGDIKSGQDSFLMPPVSRVDLSESKASRNFWVYLDENRIWSVAQAEENEFILEAGLLWHKVSRVNNKLGLKVEILSFVPSSGEPVEIMQVKIINKGRKNIRFTPTAAIPIYARGANNIRDHRHVTSLLQRVSLDKYGVISKPTLSFNEAGHLPNKNYYFVLGWDEKGAAPEHLYPTHDIFCGDSGDLSSPESVLKNILPDKRGIQGKEAMGGLRFFEKRLAPGKSCTYTLALGITKHRRDIKNIVNKFKTQKQIDLSLSGTKDFWKERADRISISSGDNDFDNWFRWVAIQPILRKIFGCSFLPDFDYGKGGRGWRDLWQDCLGLILSEPKEARKILINNFSGVRIDGSNATIIGKKQGEFIADRNNIARVWMDHGIWPLLAIDLYINETGDLNILFEETDYFCDQHIWRSRKIDNGWSESCGNKLKTSRGKVYRATVFEHLLIQNLTQFFNVGSHNHIRLEGADWNDGLDMAQDFGESVAFSAMYAKNLFRLSELLLKSGRDDIEIGREVKILFKQIDYNNIGFKHKVLEEYFEKAKCVISGERIKFKAKDLSSDLKAKAEWIASNIRKREWLKEGFFNGYYDNQKKRVEGKQGKTLKMMLASQVFTILSGVADERQVIKAVNSVERHLFDKKIGGYHLNTDFKKEQHSLGRAFSFVYGDKENGAVFSHMVVMYAYALYGRGLISNGWKALSSLYKLAIDAKRSKIYPSLPEYFDAEGRGMYSYLTGSASWFVLTILNRAFGLYGYYGDLLIEPRLDKEQFSSSSNKISIKRNFAGRRLLVNFINPRKLGYGEYKIISLKINSGDKIICGKNRQLISRKVISNLPLDRINTIDVILG